ncbi:MAG: FtsK/SpoIIIE domain-containing protein, partial [Eggerthellaceae bacterium]|nr:FtsK/SpoIIIE domain-containing protein [Eggerthellaceae bacterium]
MRALLVTEERSCSLTLPKEVGGTHYLVDTEGRGGMAFGLIGAQDGEWVLYPRRGGTLLGPEGEGRESARLDPGQEAIYQLAIEGAAATLFLLPSAEGDLQTRIVGFSKGVTLGIGSGEGNAFVYPSRFVEESHARIGYADDAFSVTDLGSRAGTYVNGLRIAAGAPRALKPADTVEVLGLTVCVGARFLAMNDPAGRLEVHGDGCFVPFALPPVSPPEGGAEAEEEAPDYFYPAPRFRRDVRRTAFTVDAPPAREKPDETPIAMKVAPSLVMALGGVCSGAFMFTNMLSNGGGMLQAAPMLVMSVSMISGAVVWPIINRHWQAKKARDAERKRSQTYAAYLDKVRLHIKEEMAAQREVLEENRITLAECARRATERDARLMDRTPAHDDFLDLRLGVGTEPFAADIRWPDEHFAVEVDELEGIVYQLAKEPTGIEGVPLAIRLAHEPVIGIAGAHDAARDYLAGLVCQLACLHSYEDVKVAIVASREDGEEWAWARMLPHLFSDDREQRYLALGLEDAAEVWLYLERIAEERRAETGAGKAFAPHYVVVCPSKAMAEKADIITSLARRPAPGFTLVAAAEDVRDLPKQATAVIEVAPDGATVRLKADAAGDASPFVPDTFIGAEDARRVARALSRVALDIAGSRTALPTSLGFMDMYRVGSLEALDVPARWREGKAATTLAAPVGLDAAGEPLMLNLHEKFHGPHGLIAGTTGSGKSEFIITWILSVCASYSPEEAAFVLIDYKGGGLAGAFDGEGARLPHLAGTITNLDGAAIARSLVSINGELKRRQALFAAARAAAGGDNVDIYRYQALWAQGLVGEPCP